MTQTKTTKSQFIRNERGNVATIFGVALMPTMFMVGVSIDYSRANRAGAMLQESVDAAVQIGRAHV